MGAASSLHNVADRCWRVDRIPLDEKFRRQRPNGQVPIAAPGLGDSITRDFAISGRCAIPVTAKAYSMNVTVVPAGPGGVVSVFVTNQTHVILDVNGYFQ